MALSIRNNTTRRKTNKLGRRHTGGCVALFFCNEGNTEPYFADSVLFITLLLLYNNNTKQEVNIMTTRERILALKLLEKQERDPEYAKRIGIQVNLNVKEKKNV